MFKISKKKVKKIFNWIIWGAHKIKEYMQAFFEATGNGAVALFTGVLWIGKVITPSPLKNVSTILGFCWMLFCAGFNLIKKILDDVRKSILGKKHLAHSDEVCGAIVISIHGVLDTMWKALGSFNIVMIAGFVIDQIFLLFDLAKTLGLQTEAQKANLELSFQISCLSTGLSLAIIDLICEGKKNFQQAKKDYRKLMRNSILETSQRKCCDNLTAKILIECKEYLQLTLLGVVDVAALYFLLAFGDEQIIEPSGLNNAVMKTLFGIMVTLSALRIAQKSSNDIVKRLLTINEESQRHLNNCEKISGIGFSSSAAILNTFFSSLSNFNFPTVTYLVINTAFKCFGVEQRTMQNILVSIGYGLAGLEFIEQTLKNSKKFYKNSQAFFGCPEPTNYVHVEENEANETTNLVPK
jgi:hypothetical protein